MSIRSIQEILTEFKEYKSTGLTPQQIELLKTENELLKIRLQQFVDEEYIISFTNQNINIKKEDYHIKIFKLEVANNEIYAIKLFGKFIDFRQWYYVWYDGEKSDSWLLWWELIYDAKKCNITYFEPIPKYKTMFN